MLQIGPAPEEKRTSDYEYEGYKFKLIATDPYGFYKVFSIKDKQYLNEQFTGITNAKIGAMKYVNNKKDK